MYQLTVFISLLVLLIGCQPHLPDEEPMLADSAYFPLATGHYIVYAVDEEHYSLAGPVVHTEFQLKERIGQLYLDASGQPAFQLERFRRKDGQSAWQPDSVWSVKRTPTEALRTENGKIFVRLHFPIAEHHPWNGNVYNTLGVDDFDIRNIHQPFRVFDNIFDRTITVIEQSDSTLISQDKRLNVYAHQIGMIYREVIQVQFCTSTAACIGRQTIDYGTRKRYQILYHGKE